jgi:hypothetical protein
MGILPMIHGLEARATNMKFSHKSCKIAEISTSYYWMAGMTGGEAYAAD